MNHADIKTFVINLESSKDRYQHVVEQLPKNTLDIERLPATEGKSLTVEQIKTLYCQHLNKKHFRRSLSLGEIGCYASHRKAWQRVIDDALPFALILEDDIVLKGDLNAQIESVRRLKNWDIIKLFIEGKVLPHETIPLEKDQSLVSYQKVPNCACAYFLSARGAKKLLSRNKFFRPVDIDFQFFNELDLNITGIEPYVFSVTTQFESDIDNQSGKSRKSLTLFHRNIAYRLQLYFHRKKYQSAILSNIVPVKKL